MEKNGTLAWPATAFASSVLPVPGGPTSRMPLGMRPPSRLYCSGFFRNSTIPQLFLGFVDAGHVVKANAGIGTNTWKGDRFTIS